MQRACADNDAAAARDALLAWSAATWPQSPPVNLTQLATRCGDALATVIADLQRALYAEESGRWNGAQLWAQAKRIAPRPAARPPTHEKSLAKRICRGENLLFGVEVRHR